VCLAHSRVTIRKPIEEACIQGSSGTSAVTLAKSDHAYIQFGRQVVCWSDALQGEVFLVERDGMLCAAESTVYTVMFFHHNHNPFHKALRNIASVPPPDQSLGGITSQTKKINSFRPNKSAHKQSFIMFASKIQCSYSRNHRICRTGIPRCSVNCCFPFIVLPT